eukprot:CAMPEP_0116006740 /NCGR_PEP_ID=MMETSP0321-20121206/1903_1 /TAXON_ID=163516 /ORGANISM="Leptocylindrus danicus var. danicus, Strain B650" /LENGTH=477 /DNA_ID=CAMNT_0003475341 /DNA_START=151 /DNA_END=1584 /DNA_ORIENTATION=-
MTSYSCDNNINPNHQHITKRQEQMRRRTKSFGSTSRPLLRRDEESTRSLNESILGRATLVDERLKNVIENNRTPMLSPDEILYGDLIGKGTFGAVFAVKSFQLKRKCFRRHSHRRGGSERSLLVHASHSNVSEYSGDDQADNVVLDCNNLKNSKQQSNNENAENEAPESSSSPSPTSLSSRCKKKGASIARKPSRTSLLLGDSRKMLASMAPEKFAIKTLSSQNLSKTILANSAVDIATEACLLAPLQHENIIKLYAVSTRQVLSSSFFIVLERLPSTLEMKTKQWRKAHNGFTKFCTLSISKVKPIQQLRRRLKITVGLAHALKYLHEKNIVYRDLKPDNVGFDGDGVVKLFDFGLARELPFTGGEDSTYALTRNAGSPRYMAPEVWLDLPYNKKVDSYSFSILLWELCSLKESFNGHDPEIHFKRVVEEGFRPKTKSWWPSAVRNLMEACWDRNYTRRPNFVQIAKVLEAEVDQV